MNKKWMIVAFSICITIVVGLIATIIVLASGTQGVGTSVSVLYVATDIEGTVSAKYSKVNKNTSAVISTTDMVTSSGSKTVSFLSTAPTTTNLLNPTESNIALTAEQDLIITYTFTAVETYYATLEYKDSSTSASNIEFSYSLNDGAYESEMSMPIEVTPDHSTTYSIKLHIANTARNANLSGSLNWALTKEGSKTPSGGDDDRITITYANTGTSSIKEENVSIVYNSDKTKFKIVGPTPTENSVGLSGNTGKSNDRVNLAAEGIVDRLIGLMNDYKSGRWSAEFYYFCTNQAVVGSTGYNDPGQAYYTSTTDSTLESWYDVPSLKINLYSCFMESNYWDYNGMLGYIGSEGDTNLIISHVGTESYPLDNNSASQVDNSIIRHVVFPQAVTSIGTEAFKDCTALEKVIIPGSIKTIGYRAFYNCTSLTDVEIQGSETIDDRAFYGCSALKTINIPNATTWIGGNAFENCTNLTKIIFEDTSKTWSMGEDEIKRTRISVADPVQNANYLTSPVRFPWTKDS